VDDSVDSAVARPAAARTGVPVGTLTGLALVLALIVAAATTARRRAGGAGGGPDG
jgi:hypothetical protein